MVAFFFRLLRGRDAEVGGDWSRNARALEAQRLVAPRAIARDRVSAQIAFGETNV
jgi:hypothetical protein